jgi:multicomponent Na+:H+ antiporter subunit B
MKNRHQNIINLIAFIFVFILALFIFSALMEDTYGKNFNTRPVEKRVSKRYIDKSTGTESKDKLRVVEYGKSGYEEDSANIVSSIVVNYRAFDTLGEILVLFASAGGVGLLAFGRRRKEYFKASLISNTALPVISFVAIVVGSTIILHGHLTPGGGFPGGALIASGIILMALVSKNFIQNKIFLVLETISGLAILIVALLGFYLKGQLLENFFPSGKVGDLLSSGIVLLLYLLIGVKVASEITSISNYFISGSKKEK